MKEFNQNFSKYLESGLRKSDKDSINSPFLITLNNAIVKDNGLRPYEDPKALFKTGLNIFPGGSFSVDPFDPDVAPDLFPELIDNVSHDDVNNKLAFTGTDVENIKIPLGEEEGHATGVSYIISGEVSDYSSGGIKFALGSPANETATVNGNGTFSFTIVSDDPRFFYIITTLSPTSLKLFNLKIYKSDTFSTLNSELYPFPKLYVGQSDTIACFQERVYVGPSGYDAGIKDDDGIDALNDLDYENIYQIDDNDKIVANVKMDQTSDFIDMRDSWYITSPYGTSFKANWGAINDDREGKTIFSPYPRANTGTYFKGRVILGGMDPDNFWNDSWLSLWDVWKDMMPPDINLTEESFDYNYILWSGIGEGLLWTMYPEIAVYGLMNDRVNYSVTRPYFFEMIRRNDIGWMPLPCRGAVKKLRHLDNVLIAYAEDGIFALIPMAEPAPGFSMKRLSNFGIHNSWDVGIGNKEHIFVDVSGRLWRISEDLSLTLLDYREYIKLNNDGTSPYNYISFNPVEDEYYIGGKVASFALTKQGMSRINKTVLSPTIAGAESDSTFGDFQGFHLSHSDIDRFEIETEVFDIDLRGIKTITFINLGVTIDSGKTVEVKVFSRYSKSGGFFDNGWKTVNNEGSVYSGASGVDFKIGIRTGSSSDYQSLKLSSMSISWKLSDKRNIRGQYAS